MYSYEFGHDDRAYCGKILGVFVVN